MSDPLVSILLPARDAAATLPSCLASIRRQSESRFECVLVDDGSRDATRAIAESVAQGDARFRVIATAAHGLVAALNTGLVACRAPLVARIDADDWMHRERLALQLRALAAEPQLAGVGSHVRIFPRASLPPGLRDYESWLRSIETAHRVRCERFVECPLPHPTWMLHREVMLALGYRDCGWPEDYDLLLRLFAAGGQMGVVPRRLVAWRDAPSRLWRRDPAYGQERFLACKAQHLATGPLRHADDYVLWGYGETGRSLRRALAALGKRAAWIVELHPRRLGETIHGALVVRPERIPSLPKLPLIASVAGAIARTEIRTHCHRLGLRETLDFFCAA
ncbi:MAG: glycosyl transferase, family 2 [Deltaproteobacteria bacterium]|nr:glycosyl transferase, family 2 [Deltaproteobacteria bacterium]